MSKVRKGTYTVLIFWVSWDSQCPKTIDHWEAVQRKYGTNILDVAVVSLDKAQRARQIAQSRDWERVLLFHLCPIDEKLIKESFNLKFVPHCALINKDHLVIR